MFLRSKPSVLLVVLTAVLTACGGSSSGGGEPGDGSKAIDGAGKPFVMWTEGGSADFQSAMKSTFLKKFGDETGYKGATDAFCCGLSKLQTQVKAKRVKWNVLQFASQDEFHAAEEAGLLQKLDPAVVPLDSLRPGTYNDYGFDAFRNAFVLGYLPKSYPNADEAPTSFDALFRPDDFPGKRCLYKYPEFAGTLEGALMGDGVDPASLYPLDVDRALDKLTSMKSDIVWYESGSEAAQLLANGTCKMAAVLNGVAQTASKAGNEITIAWDNSVICPGVVAIPKGTPDLAAAQKFLADMLTDEATQIDFYEHVAYTFPLKESNLPESVAKWAPEGENDDNTILQDSAYYQENIESLVDKFNKWLVTG